MELKQNNEFKQNIEFNIITFNHHPIRYLWLAWKLLIYHIKIQDHLVLNDSNWISHPFFIYAFKPLQVKVNSNLHYYCTQIMKIMDQNHLHILVHLLFLQIHLLLHEFYHHQNKSFSFASYRCWISIFMNHLIIQIFEWNSHLTYLLIAWLKLYEY